MHWSVMNQTDKKSRGVKIVLLSNCNIYVNPVKKNINYCSICKSAPHRAAPKGPLGKI